MSLTLDNRFEVKNVNGVEYVRVSTIPEAYRKRLNCGAKIDTNRVKVIHWCCNAMDESIEKDYFINLVSDLLTLNM